MKSGKSEFSRINLWNYSYIFGSDHSFLSKDVGENILIHINNPNFCQWSPPFKVVLIFFSFFCIFPLKLSCSPPAPDTDNEEGSSQSSLPAPGL